ncbi:hypothetical protein IFM89_029948 [Coptis chinensis]|uniref:Alpha-galactosidase n=1 Tax=Coptis chinensis TaxID=261450 RepID=A0A835HIC9_9MAGN|nr:hypothetical protein IFM89_029948 [Coptis chinensis]
MRCCTKRKPREEEEAMGYWFIYNPNRWRDHGKEKLNGQVLKEIDHPIMYSLSLRVGATPAMAKDVSPLVNMYRVTGDDWDSWSDVASHFNVSRINGLMGNSWLDLDMLHLGWLTDPGVNQGLHRNSNLTIEEQRTQMTLWSMAQTPIIFGLWRRYEEA